METKADRKAIGRRLTEWDWHSQLTDDERKIVEECDAEIAKITDEISAYIEARLRERSTLSGRREYVVRNASRRAKARGIKAK